MNRSRTVARNITVSAGAQVVSTFASLIVTPVFVVQLGISAYGLWALLSNIVRYGFLAEFGLNPTIVKYSAEYAARSERQRLGEIMTFGAILPLAMGLILIVPVWSFAPHILSAFKIPDELRAAAPRLLTMLLSYMFFFMSSSVLQALLKGIGRLDISATTGAAGAIAFALSGSILVHMHFGITGLIAASYLQVAVTAFMNYAVLRKIHGPVFGNPFTVKFKTISTLFRMSGWIQISVLSMFLGTEATVIITGIFLGVEAVAVLDIGSKLARALSALSYHFYNAFLPAVSQLEVEHGTGAAHASAINASRYVGAASLALTGLLIGANPLILRFWLGNAHIDVSAVAMVVVIMSVSYVVTNIVGVGTTALRAVGQPRLEAITGGIAAFFNVTLAIVFAPRFGLPGVLCAGLISVALSAACFLYGFSRMVTMEYAIALRNWVPRAAAAAIAATAALAGLVSALPAQCFANRAGAFAALVGLSLFYVTVLLVLMRALRFFVPADLTLARKIAPRALLPVLRLRVVQRLLAGT